MSEKSHSHSPNHRAAKNKRLPYEKSDSNGKKTENRYKGPNSNRRVGKTTGDDAGNSRRPRIQERKKCDSASFGEGYIQMGLSPERDLGGVASACKQTMVDKSTQTSSHGRLQLDRILSLGASPTDTGSLLNAARDFNSDARTLAIPSRASGGRRLSSTASSDTTSKDEEAIYNSLEQASTSTLLSGTTDGPDVCEKDPRPCTQMYTMDKLECSYEDSLKKLLIQMCNLSETQQ